MDRLMWVCLAGALGTGTRYLVVEWAANRFAGSFPVGTLIVNVVGCFFMALVMQLAVSLPSFPPHLRVVIATGFLGGLTTYSSFNYETSKLLQAGSFRVAVANLVVTTAACFVAGLLGYLTARRLVG